VKPTVKNAKKRPCKRYVLVKRLAAPGKAGNNVEVFTGVIGKRRLTPGAYRATLTAADGPGNRATPKRLAFKIVKRR
jgi:hypothetical protein